ncbi:helix-turn-helix domain-containing protein [Edaphobacillus lindanitolerans]|uniref:Transcriptional regulator n=1 Tax=Edaphobacillus lindanitolerans TaxID=550447 RepID=A0A1U7PIF5_9BACI|nr:hypothetical protein [Edaphobacillus lindanitolerans]SIT73489.1 hypothetical protein SAMN05428946_0992 [Edaphobacillus lindanitolerans]
MNVKIGFIGNDILMPTLNKVAKSLNGVELSFYFYHDEQEAINKVIEAEKKEDVLLFGGPVPYFRVKNTYQSPLPMIYLSYDGSAFYKGLMQVAFMDGCDLESVSIDGIYEEAVRDIYKELGLSAEAIHCYSIPNEEQKKLRAFHEDLYKKGNSTCAVTSVKSVHEYLRKKGIPSVLILATESSIKVGIQHAVLESRSAYFKKSQIAVGYIRFFDEADLTGYKKQQLHLERHQKLLEYAKKLSADLFSLSEGEFVFYTTRGMIERRNNDFIERLFSEMHASNENRVINVGLGFGTSAQVAGDRARKSLAFSAKKRGNQCFLIQDEETVLNLLSKQQIEYRTSDRYIYGLATKYGVSAMVIRRILEAMQILGKNRITAEELSKELNQTVRNSRRTLNEFVEKGLAVQAGEEHLGGKGRPKIVYQLLLDDEGDGSNEKCKVSQQYN